jgi:hypothetical protein
MKALKTKAFTAACTMISLPPSEAIVWEVSLQLGVFERALCAPEAIRFLTA